jgi:hypothetical protein
MASDEDYKKCLKEIIDELSQVMERSRWNDLEKCVDRLVLLFKRNQTSDADDSDDDHSQKNMLREFISKIYRSINTLEEIDHSLIAWRFQADFDHLYASYAVYDREEFSNHFMDAIPQSYWRHKVDLDLLLSERCAHYGEGDYY